MTLSAAISSSRSVGNVQIVVEGTAFTAAGTPAVPLTMSFRKTGSTQILGSTTIDTNDWQAWTDQPASSMEIVFETPGHSPVVRTFAQLLANGTVQFSKGSAAIPLAAIVLVVAAVAMYRKRAGKVGSLTTADLLPIFLLVGGVLAFDTIRRILEGLGLWDSRDTKNLDQAAADPNSWWNPNYWYNVKPAGANYSYSISFSTATDWATEIYNAMGFWNDNEDVPIAVFKRCKTRANASYIAYAFQQKYGEDLLKWLRGGWWPQDRLSDADVAEINDYVNKLPKY